MLEVQTRLATNTMKSCSPELNAYRVFIFVFQIGVAFYEMLQAVDQHCQHLSFMDPICDFLYHIKYMYTGDSVKEQVGFRKRNDLT